jgi:protein-S-isoprenylcysteine O-methyltransferase Ste14
MEDLAPRFADLLESSAAKVRALTVDRARRGITIASLAVPALVLGLFAVVFLFMTIHSALAILVGQWIAYGIQAGLFALGGALLWTKRISKEET